MTELRMRTLELNGKRTAIRLDVATWQAIDWIAGQQNRKWSEWARDKLEKDLDVVNMTAVIREAAMTELFNEVKRLHNYKDKLMSSIDEAFKEFRESLEV
jgi:predicted DNA-binding ribbon-helix-helix protein